MSTQAIIEEARALFARDGITAVRVDNVAGAAEHFDSDEVLRSELLLDATSRAWSTSVAGRC
jgi:hypothetical protein